MCHGRASPSPPTPPLVNPLPGYPSHVLARRPSCIVPSCLLRSLFTIRTLTARPARFAVYLVSRVLNPKLSSSFIWRVPDSETTQAGRVKRLRKMSFCASASITRSSKKLKRPCPEGERIKKLNYQNPTLEPWRYLIFQFLHIRAAGPLHRPFHSFNFPRAIFRPGRKFEHHTRALARGGCGAQRSLVCLHDAAGAEQPQAKTL